MQKKLVMIYFFYCDISSTIKDKNIRIFKSMAIFCLLNCLLFGSCKTCKCPAYSMYEMNKTSTTGTSKDGNILFDKSLENAKNGLNRSI